jgi:DNA-directed RNA polymerase subunit M/transcription elongation factor TFIIS
VVDEVSGDARLQYECRHCHHVDETTESTSIMVLDNKSAHANDDKTSIISEFTKYDPTIPRLHNLPCPNAACESHTPEFGKGMPEILYLRENDEKIMYVYMCCVCDHIWKHSMS